MRRNRLRALLTAGEPSIGTHLLSSWPLSMAARTRVNLARSA